ncbi:putative holin-like toxin [Oceanobacillus sp. Castelsardo]
MTVFQTLILMISFASLIVAILSFTEQKRKRSFSDVRTGLSRRR